MSTVTQSGTRSSGKRVGALILAIVGILLLVLALIYVVTEAGSLPSFIPGHIDGSTGHQSMRSACSGRGWWWAWSCWAGPGGSASAAGSPRVLAEVHWR